MKAWGGAGGGLWEPGAGDAAGDPTFTAFLSLRLSKPVFALLPESQLGQQRRHEERAGGSVARGFSTLCDT